MRMTPLRKRQEDRLRHQEGKELSVTAQEVNEMFPSLLVRQPASKVLG